MLGDFLPLFQAFILAPYPKGARQGWKERAFEHETDYAIPLTAIVVSSFAENKR